MPPHCQCGAGTASISTIPLLAMVQVMGLRWRSQRKVELFGWLWGFFMRVWSQSVCGKGCSYSSSGAAYVVKTVCVCFLCSAMLDPIVRLEMDPEAEQT